MYRLPQVQHKQSAIPQGVIYSITIEVCVLLPSRVSFYSEIFYYFCNLKKMMSINMVYNFLLSAQPCIESLYSINPLFITEQFK